MSVVSREAPAKVNLTLEVLGRRADGYHEIRSVMQGLTLTDTLTCEPADDISLTCSVPGLERGNLVLTAAALLRGATGSQRGAHITLEKRIPVAAGLGGGSADAAATLLALNDLWELRLDAQRLMELAARVGSDVPFFMGDSTALASGRGERLAPLPPLAQHWLVLAVPPLDLPQKTKTAYSLLERDDCTDGSRSEALARAIRAGERVEPAWLYNVFDRPMCAAHPLLAALRRAMEASGATGVHLAGAGPALYALAQDEDDAAAIVARLARRLGEGMPARLVAVATP